MTELHRNMVHTVPIFKHIQLIYIKKLSFFFFVEMKLHGKRDRILKFRKIGKESRMKGKVEKKSSLMRMRIGN